jgi:hypothetical protein
VELAGYSVYIAVKYLAYSSWCYLGLRLLSPERLHAVRTAAILGGARLGLGIVLGLFIFFTALSMNNATRNAPLTYFSIYVPVRIVEWTLFHLVVAGSFRGWRSIGWVIGGIVVSCFADLPIGMMEGVVVPVGRPFC